LIFALLARAKPNTHEQFAKQQYQPSVPRSFSISSIILTSSSPISRRNLLNSRQRQHRIIMIAFSDLRCLQAISSQKIHGNMPAPEQRRAPKKNFRSGTRFCLRAPNRQTTHEASSALHELSRLRPSIGRNTILPTEH